MNGSTKPITLTQTQLKGVLALSGLKFREGSPVAPLMAKKEASELGPDDRRVLQEMGWLEVNDPPQLTAKAKAILETLCQPNVTARLLLGTRRTIVATQAYSAQGFTDDSLISFVADPDRNEYFLVWGQSPATLVDTITAQVLVGPIDQTVTFQKALGADAFVVLLCILDWHLHTLLTEMLDRESNLDIHFTVRALWEMLLDGRTAYDLTWQVTLFTYLLPFLNYELDEETIEVALQEIQKHGLVTQTDGGQYTIKDPLLELFGALLPLASYAGLHVEVWDGSDNIDGTHLAFLRGRSTVLIVQPVVEESGEKVVALDCVDDVELAEVLFKLGLPGQQLAGTSPEMLQAPGHQTCPTCGAEIVPDQKFCTACGTPLAESTIEETLVSVRVPTSTSSTCPACGASVKAGLKFCTQCGASLAETPAAGGR
jgi:predicted nucleic acid-binding Zn ribbon protein